MAFTRKVKPTNAILVTNVVVIVILVLGFVFTSNHRCKPKHCIKEEQQELRTVSEQGVGGHDIPKRRLPNAIIVGSAKCGTAALKFYLMFHPDVICADSEIHFFDENHQNGLDWYREQFPLRLENQIGIEKTPSYWTTEHVPERIHRMNSSIKLIVIVCEPVRKAVSQFTQLYYKESAQVKSFDERILNKTGLFDPRLAGVREGMFYLHLQRWLFWFPLSQMHFVDGDRLVADPFSELKKVGAALNISPFYEDENFVFDDSKGFYCFNRFTKKDPILCLGQDKGRRHPPVDPVLKQRLADFYQPHNEQFMTAIGRRFSWNIWN